MANIGIDLGTTFSCVAIYRNKEVDVIANDHGKKTTPSIVSFDGNQRLIGDEAKAQMGINPTNTIYGIKRLIGRRFDDPTVQDDIEQWPFKVIDDNNRPNIKVEYQGKAKYFHPEEISAMILERMKAIAEKYLGEKVEGAVITVPAYFNDGQRQATKQAAKIAELNVLRIMNEPTAAAVAYGLNNKLEGVDELQKVVIFDFGGGTLDVTVLVIENGVFDVIATNGNTHLGGEDFDNRMVVHCLAQIKSKHDIDLAKDKKAITKLKAKCKEARRSLSQATSAIINIPSLFNDEDFNITISRDLFNQITEDLTEKVMKLVKDALEAAKYDASEIHHVVLVGGSTRILKIQDQLRALFHQSRINQGINPDEAVAMGAAIHAAKLSGSEECEELRDIVLMDVIPLSIGIQVADGKMSVIIPRNTKLPVTKTKIFTTNKDKQTTVNIEVYEGERSLTRHNHLLGELKLTGITPDITGVPLIEVSFQIDSDGVLNCTAVELKKGKTPKEVKVQSKAGLLTLEEITAMIKKAKQFRLQDEFEIKERIEARLNLEIDKHRQTSEMNELEPISVLIDTERYKAFEKPIDDFPGTSAVEKSTAKLKITTTHDNGGPMRKEEIKRMKNDIKRYRAHRQVNKQKSSSKDRLEKYCLNLKATLEMSDEDRRTLLVLCNNTSDWINDNQTAKNDEFERKQIELESVCNFIITKLQQCK